MHFIELWYIGCTWDFDSHELGSNPSSSTILADDLAPSVRFFLVNFSSPNKSGLEDANNASSNVDTPSIKWSAYFYAIVLELEYIKR